MKRIIILVSCLFFLALSGSASFSAPTLPLGPKPNIVISKIYAKRKCQTLFIEVVNKEKMPIRMTKHISVKVQVILRDLLSGRFVSVLAQPLGKIMDLFIGSRKLTFNIKSVPYGMDAYKVEAKLILNINGREQVVSKKFDLINCACRVSYPKPVIAMINKDSMGRYHLTVRNWSAYSDSLFTPAPALPACGKNSNSSRSWIDIYNSDNNMRIYGFCNITQSSDLQNSLWFKPVYPINHVHIVIEDRLCHRKYVSNSIPVPHQ